MRKLCSVKKKGGRKKLSTRRREQPLYSGRPISSSNSVLVPRDNERNRKRKRDGETARGMSLHGVYVSFRSRELVHTYTHEARS